MTDETHVIVDRISDDGEQTLSYVYVVNGTRLLGAFCGMEKPWKDNQRNVSCIPSGSYECCKRNATEKIKYRHVMIKDIPDRSGILIHSCNYNRQLQGCLGIGSSFADIDGDGETDITSSRNAMTRFMELVPDDFTIKFL